MCSLPLIWQAGSLTSSYSIPDSTLAMVQNLQQQQYLKAGWGAGAGAQLRLSYFICFIRLKRGLSYLLKSVSGKNLLLGGEKKNVRVWSASSFPSH